MSRRAVIAEFIGSLILAATVIGSGIAGDRLSGGNVAIALLANSLATGAILYVLIVAFADISGAHFNPGVTFALTLRNSITLRTAAVYICAQTVGMIAGVCVAHLMFGLPIFQFSTRHRDEAGLLFGEVVATWGLVFVVLVLTGKRVETVATAVALYIVAAYWFTSSTSFANPAITIARSLSDTFAGISPASIPGFIAMQLLATLAAVAIAANVRSEMKSS